MDKTHLREYTLQSIQTLVKQLPYKVLEFTPSVLYFPCEKQIKSFISPQSPLREYLIQAFPQLSSHFIYLLQLK